MQQQKKNLALTIFLLILISTKEGYSAINTEQSIERTQRLLDLKREQKYINEQLKYPIRKTKKIENTNSDNLEESLKYLFNQLEVVGDKSHTETVKTNKKKHTGAKISGLDGN